jgi:hypothetical protein
MDQNFYFFEHMRWIVVHVVNVSFIVLLFVKAEVVKMVVIRIKDKLC